MAGRVKTIPFGKLSDGYAARAYELRLENGVVATVTDFGASLIGFIVPDREGKLEDVVLACGDARGLEQSSAYFGAAIGRVAGRIGKAHFAFEGEEHKLTANIPPHHLHGGSKGMGRRAWSGQVLHETSPAVCFTIVSKRGDEGYPGELHASLTYRLKPPAKLVLEFEAYADEPTPFNPTCHAYFNLEGHAAGRIGSHRLLIPASRYTLISCDLIPTGEIEPVAATPFDFTNEKLIAHDWDDLPSGYDHNFVLDAAPGQVRTAAVLSSMASGRRLTVKTDRPCIHLYTGSELNTLDGKHGATYGPITGLALETQGFPDALNHEAFAADILRPGKTFFSQTIFELDQELTA